MQSNIELINFTELDEELKKTVLGWRNYPEIKKWMYTQDDITLEQHLSFIKSLENSHEKVFFLVKQDDEYIGVLYFTDIQKDETHFGLYSSPECKIAGVGRTLETLAIEYAKETLRVKVLRLEVFASNMQVRNLHKKYSFIESGTKIVNNENVVCMELLL